MSRKGISPLIAAVLLIAFTMAVASLFAQWAPQLIQNAQGQTSNQSSEIRRCSQIVYDVTSGDNESVTFQQVAGEDTAGEISVIWTFNDDAEPIQNFTSLDNNRAVEQLSHGLPGSRTGDDLDQIKLQPTNCEGAPTVTYP